jgi:hypothetical protein
VGKGAVVVWWSILTSSRDGGGVSLRGSIGIFETVPPRLNRLDGASASRWERRASLRRYGATI